MKAISKSLSCLFFCLTFCFFASTSFAASTSIYDGQSTVADYSEGVRNENLTKIIEQVLIKASGNPNILNLAPITKRIQDPASFLDSYSYQTTMENNKQVITIRTKFNSEAIKRLLLNANQKICNTDRPVTLIWLKIDSETGSMLLTTESTSNTQIFQDFADRYGIPIIIPSTNDEFYKQLATKNIVDLDNQTLANLAQTYKVNAVLTGQVFLQKLANWQAKFSIFRNNKSTTWDISEKELPDVISVINNQLLTTICNNKAEAPNTQITSSSSSEPTELTFIIDNVNNLNDLETIIQYLQTLNGVGKVEPENVGSQQVSLLVTINIDFKSFVDTLNSGKKLTITSPIDTPSSTVTAKFIQT